MLFSRFKERKGLFALRLYIAFPTNATYRLRAGGSLTTKIHDNALVGVARFELALNRF